MDTFLQSDAQCPSPTSQPSQPAQAMLPSGLGAPLDVLRNRRCGVYLRPAIAFSLCTLALLLKAKGLGRLGSTAVGLP